MGSKDKTIIIGIILSITVVILFSAHDVEGTSITFPKHIIAFWPADGNANDVTGHGHNGTLTNGVTFQKGVTGAAFSFNGVSGSVNVGSLGISHANTPFSIVAWVKPTNKTIHSADESYTIVQEGTTANNSGANGQFMMDFDIGTTGNPGSLVLEIGATQTFSQIKYVPTPLNPNQWTFVAATYNGSRTADGMKIYINGTEQSTAIKGSGFTGFVIPRDQWSIGAQGYSPFPVDFFQGSIDGVKVFSCALSSSQVMAQFQGHNVATC